MDANISRGILEVRVMGSPHEQWKTTLAGTNIREYRRIGMAPWLKNAMHYFRGHSSMLKDTLAAAKNSLIKMNGAARAT